MAARTARAPPRPRVALPAASTIKSRVAPVKTAPVAPRTVQYKVVKSTPVVDVVVKLASPASCTPLLLVHFEKRLAAESSSEKARLATGVLNASLKTLSSAVSAGFKAKADALKAPASRPTKVGKDTPKLWTLPTVTIALKIALLALKTLRELDGAGELGEGKALGVERAGIGLLSKAMALDMMDQVRAIALEAQSYIIKLYNPNCTYTSGHLPPPTSALDDAVATILFAHSSALLVTSPSFTAPPLDLPTNPMHPLMLARRLPPTTTIPYLHLLYRTLKGALRASLLGLLALALTVVGGKVKPHQVYDQAAQTFSTAIKSNTPEDILEAISYMKTWVGDLKGEWDPAPVSELEISLARRTGSVDAIEKAMGALAVSDNDPLRMIADIAKVEVSATPSDRDVLALRDLAEALMGAQAAVVAKAAKAVERARRAVVKGGAAGVDGWLVGAIAFAERIVGPEMDSEIGITVISGAIDSASKITQQTPTLDSLALLQRVNALRNKVNSSPADWSSALAWTSYGAAARLWKEGSTSASTAASFALFSCQVGKTDMPRRWELLGVCYSRMGETEKAFEAAVNALKVQPVEVMQAIEKGAAKGPLEGLWGEEAVASVLPFVHRAATFALALGEKPVSFKFIDTPAFGAIGEKLLSLLDDAPVELQIGLCDAILKVYDKMPLRRLRVASRLVELGQDVKVSSSFKPPHGPDTGLALFLPEYQGLFAIFKAFAAYNAAESTSNMPLIVLRHAISASSHLRQLVGKRKDDANRLCRALAQLCDLLGLLGHTLVKVDCLRLLRQLQRKDPPAYSLTSARLGSEYAKLGKSTRAALVFAQVTVVTVESQLRYAAFLASVGNLEKSAQTYSAAKEATENDDRVIALQMAALAHVAVAVLASGKDDSSGLVFHLSLAFRAWTRAADLCTRRSQNSWAFTENLLDCTFALALAYLDRGSVRDAEYFLKQAEALATTVHSSAYAARAVTGLAALQAGLGAYDISLELLEGAAQLAFEGVDAIDVDRTKGDVHAKRSQEEEAEELFIHAADSIKSLDAGFTVADSVLPSPRKPSKAEPILPAVLSHVLRQQTWLYHKAGLVEAQELHARVMAMASTPELKAAEQDLLGRMAMQDAFNQFKTDLFMNSLMESTISLPMGNTAKPTASKSAILAVLERADRAFRTSLSLRGHSGKVPDIRQAYLSLALIRAFQTALGQGSTAVTAAAADAINSSISITLRRERYDLPLTDELVWPELRSATIPEAPSLESLPAGSAVVSITVTDDLATMFVSRQQAGRESLVFCLPLDRQSRRDGDEAFTFAAAITELREIIEASDYTAKTAKTVESREEKVAWWGQRRKLDKRLEELLATIEFCWLGAFKTVFNGAPEACSALVDFKKRIETIFKRVLGCKRKIKLGIECFATLSPRCRSEELEDFVYFVLDLYQFHGVPVALAELDIDQIGIDVKAALHEYEAAVKPPTASGDVFLVLDKNVQGIPWESIPALRGRPISRVPSIDFLVDRKGGDIDPSKVFFILNPSGDLLRTQEYFEPWIAKKGWKGITGRAPLREELIAALTDHDLVLYFGHGGAEQYIHSHKVRQLPNCATTMLWGCSSGALKEQGDFDRVGTALHYMVGGCPSLTANLWDVTDRDIDRLCEEVFNRMGLGPNPTGNESTAEAVNGARDDCKLRYLTGAAPVVYGIPKRLVGIFSA